VIHSTMVLPSKWSFFTVIHDARMTIRYTKSLVYLLILTFLPFWSLIQSARMLREVVTTMETAEALMDLPSIRILDDGQPGRRLLTGLHPQYPSRQQQHQQHQHHPLVEQPQRSTPSDRPPQRKQDSNLHLVISHCDLPIDWIWRHYLWNRPFRSMTILTKCNQPPSNKDLPPVAFQNATHPDIPLIQVLELPNVGRCDHSYAFWMSKLLGNNDVEEITPYSLTFTNNGIDPTHVVTDMIQPDDIILFMKDNDNAYRANMDLEVPLQHMIDDVTLDNNTADTNLTVVDYNSLTSVNFAVSKSGPNRTAAMRRNKGPAFTVSKSRSKIAQAELAKRFACGTRLRTGFPGFYSKLLTIDERERASNMANRRSLWSFSQGEYSSSAGLLQRSEDHGDFLSSYRPMGKWIRHLQNDLGAFVEGFDLGQYRGYNYDLVPVCFGGNFMTSLRTIQQSPVLNWTALVETLSRGDNIEEGHYMERLWAQLLSPPLPKAVRNDLIQRTSRHFLDGAFAGMIITLTSE
jgi:hypothetical protein